MPIDIGHATPGDFYPLLSEELRVELAGVTVTMVLDNVKIFERSTIRDARVEIDGKELPPRQAFALTLEGAREPVFSQQMCRISHPQIGEIDVFLSPFRQDATCALYEVVFN